MESVDMDSSDVSDDGLGDDNDKQVIIIPITHRTPEPLCQPCCTTSTSRKANLKF